MRTPNWFKEQGISEASRKIAINLLNIKMDMRLVASTTGLSIQEIHKIHETLKKDKINT